MAPGQQCSHRHIEDRCKSVRNWTQPWRAERGPCSKHVRTRDGEQDVGGLQGGEEARKVTSKQTLKSEIKDDKASRRRPLTHTSWTTRRPPRVERGGQRVGGSQHPAQCLSALGCAPGATLARSPGPRRGFCLLGDAAASAQWWQVCASCSPCSPDNLDFFIKEKKNGVKISTVLGTGAKARFWPREESLTLEGEKQLHKKSTVQTRRLQREKQRCWRPGRPVLQVAGRAPQAGPRQPD